MTTYDQIRLNLVDLRVHNGLSQEDVAKLTDVSQGTISRIESGKNTASLDLLFKLLKVYKVDITLTKKESRNGQGKTRRMFKDATPLTKSHEAIMKDRKQKNRRRNKLAREARRKTRAALEPKKRTPGHVRGLTDEERAIRDLKILRKKDAGVKKKAFKAEQAAKLESEKQKRRNTLVKKVARGMRAFYSGLIAEERRRKGLLKPVE